MVKICTTVVTLLFAINIIFFYPATYLKENRLDFKVLEERKLDSQIELYDLNTILLFDDNVWCLNVSKNCIMVFSKEGKFKKAFCLPGVRDKGSSQMYIYHDQLCVRDKHNTLYQFSSVDEYKKIILKNYNEVQVSQKNKIFVYQKLWKPYVKNGETEHKGILPTDFVGIRIDEDYFSLM